ncbi:hypothetical protein HYS95_03010 [Candidatus Daviesbacteria bacterium]|nr:hypothetical protein [Candidatus Daviesbacteria bacterium]
MEKAILKTLIYAGIFNYPLKINEIHKWLVGKRSTLRQIEKAIQSQESRIKSQGRYFFLKNQNGLVARRKRAEKQSEAYFQKAKMLSYILKVVPWIKLVGVSGGLAMNNAGKSDDIDLFIITGKNRLWISRLLVIGLLSLVSQRRKRIDKGRGIAGKLCLNILLEEDRLEQKNKDIFVAHEVLQMRPLWQRDGVYSRYLADNEWVFKYLPNWISCQSQKSKVKSQKYNSKFKSFDLIENLAKWFQLKIMRKPQGMERIEEGALYFHPNDCREKVLSEYRQRLKLATLDK